MKAAFYVAVFLVTLFVIAAGQDSESRKREIEQLLLADGITNLTMTGYDPFACSQSDTFADGFIGNKGGRQVTGVVCSGFLKGATIRYTEVK